VERLGWGSYESTALAFVILVPACWLVLTRFFAEDPARRHGALILWWCLFFLFHVFGYIAYLLLNGLLDGYVRRARFGRRLVFSDKEKVSIVMEAIRARDPSGLYEPEVARLLKERRFEEAFALAERKRDLAREMGNTEMIEKYTGLVESVRGPGRSAFPVGGIRERNSHSAFS